MLRLLAGPLLAAVLLSVPLALVSAADREVWSIYDTVENRPIDEGDQVEEVPPDIVYSLGFRMEDLVQVPSHASRL